MRDKHGNKILDFDEKGRPIIGFDKENGNKKLGETGKVDLKNPNIGYLANM